MTAPAAAHRWVCGRCGVSAGRLDGARLALPGGWVSSAEGDFCLSCRRERAADAAQDAAAGEDGQVRARARRTGVIEFEVQRTPGLTDATIARACHSTSAAVATARRRLRIDDGPPPGSDRNWSARRGIASGRGR